MTTRERLHKIFTFQKPDRIPMLEWASWWGLTIERWQSEGLDPTLDGSALHEALGLEPHIQFWLAHRGDGCSYPKYHGGPMIEMTMEAYEAERPHLLPEDAVSRLADRLKEAAKAQENGTPVWMTLEGFFWNPRVLLGIEPHLYSFYDEPELYHRICEDLSDWHLRMIDQFCEYLVPDFMTFAEDMSYNNGPMLSEECFNEFLLPYYQKVIPALKARGIHVIVDTDGQAEPMIPWLRRAGIEGLLPMERQAGVDEARIREMYPDFLMLGGFDKMTMFAEPGAMEAEFERLLPVMKTGGFIPSVDHQTPPSVSLEQYRHYIKLLEEYCTKACQ